MASSKSLTVQNVGFHYPTNPTWACRHIDLEVSPGEMVALLGPNGAGKSTLLSLITGARQPCEGRIEILGANPNQPSARRNLGVAPQDSAFPKTVRVSEVLNFVLAQYDRALDPELCATLHLEEIWSSSLGKISGGERRRVGLACALIARPALIVLDEPTAGLDLESRYDLFAYLKKLVREKGLSVLFSTHHFNEVEVLADRVMVMHLGHKLREGSILEMRRALSFKRIRFEASQEVLIPELWRVTKLQSAYEVMATNPEDFMRWLVGQPIDFTGLEIHPASLEEIFIQLVAL